MLSHNRLPAIEKKLFLPDRQILCLSWPSTCSISHHCQFYHNNLPDHSCHFYYCCMTESLIISWKQGDDRQIESSTIDFFSPKKYQALAHGAWLPPCECQSFPPICRNCLFNSAGEDSGYVLGHLLSWYDTGTQPAVSCGYKDETAKKVIAATIVESHKRRKYRKVWCVVKAHLE